MAKTAKKLEEEKPIIEVKQEEVELDYVSMEEDCEGFDTEEEGE